MNRRRILTLVGGGFTLSGLYSFNLLNKSAMAANITVSGTGVPENKLESNMRFKFTKFEISTTNINPNQDITISIDGKIKNNTEYNNIYNKNISLTEQNNTEINVINQLSEFSLSELGISNNLSKEGDELELKFKISINHDDVDEIIKIKTVKIVVTPPTVPESMVLEYVSSDFVSDTTTWKTPDGTESLDFYVNNPSKTTFSNGDVAVKSNGGLGIFQPPPELNGSSLQQVSIEMDMKSSSGGDPSPWGFADSNGNLIRLNFNEGNNFYINMRDSSGNELRATPMNTLSISDGIRHKVSVSIDGPSNNMKVIVDGTDVPLNYISSQSPTISTNLKDTGFGIMGLAIHYENGGNSRRSANGLYRRFRFHDKFITDQTI